MEERERRKTTILELINDKNYKPLKQKELAFLLQVSSEDREEFRSILAELVSEGKIILTKRGKYQSLSDITKIGTFMGHYKGFGFVAVDDEEDDYYIPDNAVGDALNGDRVMIKITEAPPDKRKEALIVKVLQHANTEIVGYYQKKKRFGFVIPDDRKLSKDIFIPEGKSLDAVTGHKVVVKIDSFGDKDHNPEGEIVEILGHVNDPGTDIISIIRSFGLPMEFPDEVVAEAAEISDEVGDNDITGRLDLRNVMMVTIDGEDAKDLDDAVSLERTDRGYRLGVHIADVSYYVREGSLLDKEALKRGTSVYLIDRVIPMLPQKLSNGICSLNEGCDRLALSCIMDIDDCGKVIDHKISESVIRVDKRMSYDKVFELLDKGNVENGYEGFATMLFDMKELSEKIRKRRRERGSVDFDFPEAQIKLAEDGRPVSIGVRERNPAHMLIEDFMLIANETIAEDYYWQDLPFEYRVHDKPDPEKTGRLKKIIEKFGYYIKASSDDIHPKELQKLLNKVAGKDEENFINRIVLRSMQQARYSTNCSGHFGLAARYYCHFTSPIRRYPDLQIHRIIKKNLHGGLTDELITHYNNILPSVADSNSKLERRAEEAEREVEKLKKVQYMSRHIGDVYDGIISGVTAYGFFVELPNTVEGLVRMAAIPDDYYLYDEENMVIVGKETGNTYQMGQRVKVYTVMVDKKLLTIDFELAYG